MRVTKLSLENIKSFAGEHSIEVSKNINLLVGPNNAGKTTILKSIYLLQNKSAITFNDKTLGTENSKVQIFFEDIKTYVEKHKRYSTEYDRVIKSFESDSEKTSITGPNGGVTFSEFPSFEPQNIIYPFLSKRKNGEYDESVNQQATNSVTDNFQHLNAKLTRLCSVGFPQSESYKKSCQDIVGLFISTVAAGNGQKAAYVIDEFSQIDLVAMGEGTLNLLGLIERLCVAKNQIFLIEEPENDIHPKALKALLNLIEIKSNDNQFFITTHSNIVTKYLGSVSGSKIFKVSMTIDEKSRVPVSNIKLVENTPEARREVLEELGYEFYDFDLHKGWLFLEEATAERVIREFLIPHFADNLRGSLATFSAKSISEVKLKFDDFNRLFVFTHLQPIYKNRAWVIIDGGDKEAEIITRMKGMYSTSGWCEDNFQQFTQHDFERYYPERFQPKVDEILKLNGKEKSTKKTELLLEVKEWWEKNPEEAKKEFEISAKEVIEKLQNIANQLN